MFDVRALNIAIELWGVAFCAISIGCVLLYAREVGRYRTLLLSGFAAEIVAAGGDALAGMFRGQEGTFAQIVVYAGNHATFIGNFVLISVLTAYLCARIHEVGGSAYRSWSIAVSVTAAFMCVLTLAGAFFYVDEGNLYHRSDWFWIATAYVVAVDAVNAVLVVINRKRLGTRAFACLLFYTVAPIIAATAQALVYSLNFVIVAGVMGLVVVFFEMQQHTSRVLMARTEELVQSRVEVSESRIAVMVSQIQPHFLFNTLDTIYGLVDEDTGKAKKAIHSFSRYLRANLDSLKHTSAVPIEREMDHVRTYLELERMSDEGRVEYELDVQATGFKVPALSVQTIVENAVKHGLSSRAEGGRVIVRTREQAEEYTVAVIDNGVGFDVESVSHGEGVGLPNTRSRLQAMCGGTLEVTSEPGVGTTVILHIPKSFEGTVK